jgi:retinol dehydrogenase 12
MGMTGKVVLVTGASSGIGKVTARELARMGARVVCVARDQGRGEAAIAEIRAAAPSADLDLLLCDFASQRAIRALSEQIHAKHDRLHVLVNNAGAIMASRTVTEDGIEATFAVNHLGYFLLTELLLDLLKAGAPSRIVNVASGAHKQGKLDLDDVSSERGYSRIRAYSTSKLANILFTNELARRLEGTNVTANSLHPGAVSTNFGSSSGYFKYLVALVRPFLIDAEKGAETLIHLASSPEVAGVSGEYFYKKKIARRSARASDPVMAARLWEVSEELTRRGGQPGNTR